MISFKDFCTRVNHVYQRSSLEGSADSNSISWDWITGGQSGRSCWGGEYYSVSGESEPDSTILDDILTELAPDISFMQFRKIKGMFRKSESQRSDYYGNYTNVATQSISTRLLYDELNAMSLLED